MLVVAPRSAGLVLFLISMTFDKVFSCPQTTEAAGTHNYTSDSLVVRVNN